MPRHTATVVHELGKDEALTRLQSAVARARSIADLKGEWEDGAFDFSVRLQGLRIAGRIKAEDDRLTFDGTLPLFAMPFRNWIPRMLKKALEPLAEASPSLGADISAPAVLFLHIPKAGGRTVGEFIDFHARDETVSGDAALPGGVAYLSYGFFKERTLEVPAHVFPLLERKDLRAVVGHFWFGLHEHVARPSVYVTLLRDPVERIVSLYYFAKVHETMTLAEFASEPPFPEIDNDQTRRIAGVDPGIGGCTAEMLRKAKENLRRFAVAGTIERLDETLVLLKRRLGWRSSAVAHTRNVTPGRPALAALPRETVEAIRKRNELDLELWRYASELLDEAIAAEGDGFHRDLGEYRAMKQKEGA